MIDAAVEAGVKRFIPSEFGFDTEDDRTLEVAPCTIMKKDPVDYMKAREDRMSWTSIVNGLWLEWVSPSSGGVGLLTTEVFEQPRLAVVECQEPLICDVRRWRCTL